jgi:hypothetical protein
VRDMVELRKVNRYGVGGTVSKTLSSIEKLKNLGYRVTEDGSFERISTGDVTFFSLNRFIKDITKGNCCFLCGASPDSKPFNEEHVVPKWILSDFNLFEEQVVLPNGKSTKYKSYTIRCCKECNSLLGDTYENPISRIVRGGYNSVIGHIQSGSMPLIYCWLALIFIKKHLKDLELPVEKDTRNGNTNYIHTLARAAFTKPKIGRSVFGSFLVLKADTKTYDHIQERYDYVGSSLGRTLMLRLNDVCFFASFHDCGAALSNMLRCEIVKPHLGPLSPVQSRELHAHFTYNNLILTPRPTYYSGFVKSRYSIFSKVPTLRPIFNYDENLLKHLNYSIIKPLLPDDVSTLKSLEEDVHCTFLYNEDETFNTNSFRKVAK